MKLSTARDQFISHKREDGRTPMTQRTYLTRVNLFINWVLVTTRKESVLQFTVDLARAYVDYRLEGDLSMHTVHLDTVVLREFARWGNRKRYWAVDLDDMPYQERPQSLPRPYAPVERDALMALPLGAEDEVLRAVLYYAGLRSAEALGIRLQHITPPYDGLEGHIRVMGKGAKERIVDIHADLWVVLERFLRSLPKGTKSERFLLAQRDGGPWSNDMVQGRMRAWAKLAGVSEGKAHRMRHTFATDVLKSTGNLRLVQELLGHSSPTTTMLYTKVDAADRRAAVRSLPSFHMPSGYPAIPLGEQHPASNVVKTRGKTGWAG